MIIPKEQIQSKFTEIEQALSQPDVLADQKKLMELSKQHARLREQLEAIANLESIEAAIAEAQENLADPDFAELAQEELEGLEPKREEATLKLRMLLLPPDPNDEKNVIIEIRAGAGGDESALFAAELFRMYSRYAEIKGWKPQVMNMNRTELGGVKEIVFEMSGEMVYGEMKYESGVHRVQRVPETEKSGRIHTSTATVAVLPEAEEYDIEINESDLRIDRFCASGAGGQSVNKTESAIRITHEPTGVTVSCQNERSQQQNKAKAMQILRARLVALEEEKRMKELGEDRKSKVGTGDRSEKIRTYNFPQDRITDHRISKSWNNIPTIMDGSLESVIMSLKEAEMLEKESALHNQ
jgi:peptide chain release factor 1